VSLFCSSFKVVWCNKQLLSCIRHRHGPLNHTAHAPKLWERYSLQCTTGSIVESTTALKAKCWMYCVSSIESLASL
jgi:hypothetical protein